MCAEDVVRCWLSIRVEYATSRKAAEPPKGYAVIFGDRPRTHCCGGLTRAKSHGAGLSDALSSCKTYLRFPHARPGPHTLHSACKFSSSALSAKREWRKAEGRPGTSTGGPSTRPLRRDIDVL